MITVNQSRPTCRKALGLRVVALVIWLTVMLWLSLAADPPGVSGPLGWDKLLHAVAYGLLALLLALVIVQARGRTAGAWWRTWVLAVGFGIGVEFLQMIAGTGRTAEWGDVLADALGALVVCVIFRHAVNRHWLQPIRYGPQHG